MVSTSERGAGCSPAFWVGIVRKIPQSALCIVRMWCRDFHPASFLGSPR